MPRRLICLLLMAYAMVFAFGAMTAVRWPSIVMVMGWIVNDDLAGGLQSVNWRELGLMHGGAYFTAALCYYLSAASLAARERLALVWQILAMTASIPTIFLVHFDAGWWQDPDAGEGAMAGLAAGAFVLLLAVLELQRPARPPRPPGDGQARKEARKAQAHPPVFIADIVVRRQHALFAQQARRGTQFRGRRLVLRRAAAAGTGQDENDPSA